MNDLKTRPQTQPRTFTDEELYDLRPHQVTALNRLANGKILWGGVGTGKSRVAAAYYAKNEASKRVYVITTAKKRDSFDWQEEFYRIGVGPLTGPIPESTVPSKGRGRRTRSSGTGHREIRELNGSDTNNLVGRSLQSDSSIQSHRSSQRGGGIEKTHPDHRGVQSRTASDVSGIHHAVSTVLDADGSGRNSTRGNDFDNGKAGAHPWVLTVDSWNNIAKYADVAGAFFIFDEQRLVGSGDWTRKFLRIAKRNNWILLSGTPGDTWMDYIPVFVANDFYKNRSAFKREHVVYNTFTKFPKVDRYIGLGKLMKHRRDLLVDMPYERHTTRRVVEVELEYDKELLEQVLKKRWNIYTDRPLRDVAEMFSVGRRLVNSHPSRLEKVKELWTKHPKLIIFYNFNYELEILRSIANSTNTSTMNLGIGSGSRLRSSLDTKLSRAKLDLTVPGKSKKSGVFQLPSAITTRSKTLTKNSEFNMKRRESSKATSTLTPNILAEWNGHKHEPIPVGEKWIYLVQYTAGAEGWNCIETDAMIMYSRNYSWKVLEQSFGRIDRLNTPFDTLWYYDLMTNSFIDQAIGRALKAKETFNEAKYASLFRHKELVRV